ncbi:MAG: hypothetical protein ACRDAX_07825 [Propionibacteriaceae bacterium]
MAEIRKHNPTVKSAVDAAILAAMGEPVTFVTPGSVTPQEPIVAPQQAVSIASISMPTGTWLQVTSPTEINQQEQDN